MYQKESKVEIDYVNCMWLAEHVAGQLPKDELYNLLIDLLAAHYESHQDEYVRDFEIYATGSN